MFYACVIANASPSRKSEERGLECKKSNLPAQSKGPVYPPEFSRASIQTLPQELISMIFSYIPEFLAFLVFALASEKLFRVARITIHSVIQSTGPWTEHRLFCASDNLQVADIPKSILDEDMRKLVKPDVGGIILIF